MHGPVLVNWLLAALAAATGGYCLSRLRRRSPCPGTHPAGSHAYESDAAEALMALGMAAMAVAGTAVPPLVWAWLFGLPAAGFLLAALGSPGRRAHRLHHAIGALAMTYMALAMAAAPAAASSGPSGHGSHGGHPAAAGVPLLTGALLLYFGGYTLWAGTRLLHAPAAGPPVGTTGLPRACRLVMGISMFAMLLTV